MKKQILTSLVAISLAFGSSCEKDDDTQGTPPPSSSELIKGNWDLEAIKTVEFENGVKVDEENESGSMEMMLGESDYLLVEDSDSASGTYVFTDDSLFFYGEAEMNFGLDVLSKSTLELSNARDYNFGDTLKVKYESTFIFKRL